MFQRKKTKIWLIILLSIAAIIVAAYLVVDEIPFTTQSQFQWGNLSLFLLVNVNIVVLLVLGFLVIKNLVKLILDRRKNILGAKLRTRLVGSFVGLSLIPTVLLFLFAKGIIEKVLEEWFSPQVSNVVSSAIDLGNYQYAEFEAEVRQKSRVLAKEIAESTFLESCQGAECLKIYKENFRGFLNSKKQQYNFAEIYIATSNGENLKVNNSEHFNLAPVKETNIAASLNGNFTTISEAQANLEFLRDYYSFSLILPDSNGVLTSQQAAIVTTTIVPRQLNKLLSTLVDSYDDYNELKTYHRPLSSSYFLMMLVVTLLIVFSAMWIGFYLAKELSIPLGLLAQGTAEVAQGNLDFIIPEVGDDELTVLVKAFNTMTKDLKETTGELVQRRRYMEAVLASVGVGVISFDMKNRITTCNSAGREMLGISTDEVVQGQPLEQFLPGDVFKKFKELGRELFTCDEQVIVSNVSIGRVHTTRHFQVTLTKLVDDQGTNLGAVALCDDLTELVHAQRMAAWREVAKRIAHEIKNPLTPIQLSAERIQRRIAKGREQIEVTDCVVINDCTQTIVRQVETMRLLVDEFSRFARMPRSMPSVFNLNDLVREAMAIYQSSHPRIRYALDLDSNLPEFLFDREQVLRVLVNLIDNSIASINSTSKLNEDGEICTRTHYNSNNETVSLSISDNGVGISDTDKAKLFEPNFSKKKGGTGLGLSIVQSIIIDHGGSIRVFDNATQGVLIVIELPITLEMNTMQNAS